MYSFRNKQKNCKGRIFNEQFQRNNDEIISQWLSQHYFVTAEFLNLTPM